MSTNYDVILSPVITEKATRLTEANQVVFRVTLEEGHQIDITTGL